MPIDTYFKGRGESVMESMQSRYGAEKGKRIFYATSNAHPSMKPSTEPSPHADRIRGIAKPRKDRP